MSDSSVTLRRLTFRKNERLCSRKIIQELSLEGKNIHVHPLRLVWLPVQLPSDVKAQAAFAVPKRIFKDATDRNRMKRRMRESYRKNKSSLYPLISQGNLQYALLFVYTGKELISYTETEEKTKLILHRFVEHIQKNSR